jgi:hypothetical protein
MNHAPPKKMKYFPSLTMADRFLTKRVPFLTRI